MKNLTMILLLFCLALPAFSQVVIEPDDIPRDGGTVFTYFVQSDMRNGVEVDLGNPGADLEWDFTDFISDEFEADTLFDPENAPHIDLFEEVNRVVKSARNDIGMNMGAGYQYESVTDSGWYMRGTFNDRFELGRPVVYPEPVMIMPLPAEYEDEWDIAVDFSIPMAAPDSIGDGLLDSIYINIAFGGFAEMDGWGSLRFSGGNVEALRQHIRTGGEMSVIGVRTIMGRRIEIPLYQYDYEASHIYRWLSPEYGVLASITSMPGEDEENFDLASHIRIRSIISDIAFQDEPVDFGVVHVGNAGLADITIRNDGEGMGIVSEIEFSVSIMNEMEILSDLPVEIDPGEEAALRLLWNPTQERTLEGKYILLTHNDPDEENPFELQLSGVTAGYSITDDVETLSGFTVGVCYPNPFNDRALIPVYVKERSAVDFEIYDLSGRLTFIYSVILIPGKHYLNIDGRYLSEGSYLYRITNSEQNETGKFIYLK